jgi:hypothetical protein
VSYSGGPSILWRELVSTKDVLFWLMLGGFIWVIGDLFQNYAAKYIGISRGVPLSNTNQLWGLVWGILVFGELRGLSSSTYAYVIGGSVLMAVGAGAIALSSASEKEHGRWQEAAQREGQRYGIDASYVQAGLEGRQGIEARHSRTWFDWLLVTVVTGVFVVFAILGRAPQMALNWNAVAGLALAMLLLLSVCGIALWRTTRFN